MKRIRITKSAWRNLLAGAVVLGLTISALKVFGGYREFRSELTGMYGIRLNDSRAEVSYRLGSPPYVVGPLEPLIIDGEDVGESRRVLDVVGPEGDQNTMPAGRTTREYQAWLYPREKTEADLLIEFDADDRVQSIVCTAQGEARIACGPLAGIWNTDTEEKLLNLLGPPSINSVNEVTKTIEYSDIGVRYHLTQGRVYSLILTGAGVDEMAVARRYIERILP